MPTEHDLASLPFSMAPTLGGDRLRKPVKTTPSIGSREAGGSELFADWLASLGWPRWQAERIGLAAGFTPMAAAYDAGRMAREGNLSGAGLAAFGAIPGARLPASLRATARNNFSRLSDAQLEDLSSWLSGSYQDFRRGVHSLPERTAQQMSRISPEDFGLRLDNAVYGNRHNRYAHYSIDRTPDNYGTPLGGTSAYGIRDIEDPKAILEALQHARYASQDWLNADRLTLLGNNRGLGSSPARAGTDPGEFLFRNPMVVQQWRIGRSGASKR